MTTRYSGGLRWLVVFLVLMIGGVARAQVGTWVQIEAQPSLAKATERARAYASAFPDVAGFALQSGWYGIVLGPYTPDDAARRLTEMKRERLIPSDSFVADGGNFRDRYWPVAGDGLIAPQPDAVIPVDPAPVVVAEPAIPAPQPDETPAEARRAEADLPPADRQELQAALKWFGFYDATIDGAFGPGTRNAMAAWQGANAAEPTGILTTAQRATLVGAHQAALAELGLGPVAETEAGINIDLPLAMVQFDHYEPPFVHYTAKGNSGVSVLLISQPGDEATLAGLYDLMQSLEIVPLDGPRSREDRSFEISGRNASIESFTHVELDSGLIKGFTLVWPVADGARMARVLEAMKTSFRAVGDTALDPGLAPMNDTQRQGLLSGLEVRHPALSRSGFFIDATGTVLTTTDVVQSCSRITIDGEQDMTLRLSDATTGLAVLSPTHALAPPAVAAFKASALRPGADVAVAGYPFEDTLTAPTLTFGRLEALTGLNGETGLSRLSLTAQKGDAGGPVVDTTGAVIGMLLPRDSTGQVLPDDVSFAIASPGIAARLLTEGITLIPATAQTALLPDDLTRRARGMTVLVSCWK